MIRGQFSLEPIVAPTLWKLEFLHSLVFKPTFKATFLLIRYWVESRHSALVVEFCPIGDWKRT